MKIKDNLFFGLLIGLLSPLIGIIIFYKLNFTTTNIQKFVEMTISKKILAPVLSLSCLLNLAIFYLFIHYEHYFSARGVILATFIYGFVIIALKFFI